MKQLLVGYLSLDTGFLHISLYLCAGLLSLEHTLSLNYHSQAIVNALYGVNDDALIEVIHEAFPKLNFSLSIFILFFAFIPCFLYLNFLL